MTLLTKLEMLLRMPYYFTRSNFAEYRYRLFTNKTIAPEDVENIENKVVVITGAGQGIGKVTALEFSRRNAIVVLGCLDMNQGYETAKEIVETTRNENVEAIHLDLSDMDSVEKFAAIVSCKYPEIQILVNNGGIGAATKGNEKTKDGFNLHIAVNYLGHFLLTNLLLENLKRTKTGRVLAISSIVAMFETVDLKDFMMDKNSNMGFFNLIPYSNSCFAICLFMQELGKRTQGKGVATYTICPSYVNTQLWDSAKNSSRFTNFGINIVKISHGFTVQRAVSEFVMYCCLSKKLGHETGKMYRFKRHFTSRRFDANRSSELWNLSCALVRLEERMSRLNKL